jgi:hypothetical protein
MGGQSLSIRSGENEILKAYAIQSMTLNFSWLILK